MRELIRLFESASASTLNSSSSPIDIKRATISAAVSVGELLRRASEQQVTSSALQDVCANQPKISSPTSTEALSSADVGDERLSTPEAAVVVHKSTARWPTISRRKHARRHIHTISVSDSAASRNDLDRPSEIRNSRSDDGTAPVKDDREKLPQVDDSIGKNSKAVPRRSEEGVKQINDDSCECHRAAIIHSSSSSSTTDEPAAQGCDGVAGTSKLSSPAVSDHPTTVDSASFSSPAGRQKDVCCLPTSSSSSSSSFRRPSKSPGTCEVAVTADTFRPVAGGCGDLGGRHEEGVPTSSDVNKCHVVHLNEDVHPPTNYTASRRPVLPSSVGHARDAHFDDEVHPSMNYTALRRPVLCLSVGHPQERLIPTALPENVALTTDISTEVPLPEVATSNGCQRFNNQSWFVAGGPRLVEVPRWPSTSGKDFVAIVHQSVATAKATLEIETSCPALYPVLRMTDVTVHLVNKVDVDNIHVGEGNGTAGIEHTADPSSRGEKRPSAKSTTRRSDSREVRQRMVTTSRLPTHTHRSSRAVAKSAKGDEKLCEKSANSNDETVCSAATTKTARIGHELDVVASPGAALRGRGDTKTLGARKNRDRTKRDYKSVASSSRRTATDVTSATCLHDDTPSKDSGTTPPTRTSSVMANCRLVSGEPIQSTSGVTVVHSRRRTTSDRPSVVTFKTSSQADRHRTQPPATDSYKRLAQQFLLTSLLEYRLESQRK